MAEDRVAALEGELAAEEVRVAALEEELGAVGAALDAAVLEKDALHEKLDELNQFVEDLKLEMHAELLNKDVEILALEEKSVELDALKQQLAENHDQKSQASKEVEMYKKAFETVKGWHSDLTAKLAERTGEITSATYSIRELEHAAAVRDDEIEKQGAVIERLEGALMIDEELIQQSEEVELALKEQNMSLATEMAAYKEAWVKMTAMVSSKESQRKQQVTDLTHQVAELQESLANAKEFLAPRWQRLAEEHLQTGGSLPSAKFKCNVSSMNNILLNRKLTFLLSCVPQRLWDEQIERVDLVLSIYRCIGQSNYLSKYLCESHYKDLVQDADDNPLSVVKDKGFIRWLQQTSAVCAHIIHVLSRVAHNLRHLPQDSFLQSTAEGSVLAQCVAVFESDLRHLVDAASSDHLSSAIDVRASCEALKKLENVSVAPSSSDNSAERQLPLAASPIQQCAVTKQPGILVPVVRASLYRLMAIAVLGRCGAAYTDVVAEALESSLWHNLWVALGHCMAALDKNADSSFDSHDFLQKGFGVLIPRGEPDTVFKSFDEAVTSIEDTLRSVDDRTADDVKDLLGPSLTFLVPTLAEIESMCVAYVPAFQQRHEDECWKALSAAVLDKLSNVVKLENAVEEAESQKTYAKKKVDALQTDITKAHEEIEKLQESSSRTRVYAERYEVVEAECKQLRLHTKKFTNLVEKLTEDLAAAREAKERYNTDNRDLSKQLTEAKKAIEMSKKIPKHQHQSEWDAMELMHLRAVIGKLERELYNAQLEHVERDLEPSDLEKFVTNISISASSPCTATTPAGPTAQNLKRGDSVATGGDTLSVSTSVEDAPCDIAGKLEQWDADENAMRVTKIRQHEEHERQASKILRDFVALRQSVWQHAIKVVRFNNHEAPSAMHGGREQGRQIGGASGQVKHEYDSLQLGISMLRVRAENYLRSRWEGTAEKSGFGDYHSVSASRYLRSFADLSKLSADSKSQVGQPLPIARINVPTVPEWLSRSDIHCGAEKVKRVFVTEDQLQSVHRNLLGVSSS